MTVILPYCFLEELLGAAEFYELTAGTEVTLYWFALGSQLVCHVIQRHALKALVGQPSPHVKVCNRKKGNVYGLQKRTQFSLIRSNKNLENILRFIRLCNFSQSLCHQKEIYGRQIIPQGPTGMFLHFCVQKRMSNLGLIKQVWVSVFLIQGYILLVGEPVIKFC